MQRVNKIIYMAAIVIAVILLVFTTLFCSYVPVVYAATNDNLEFDKVNVMDDLQGGTIGGKPFDLADYPYDEKVQPQVITLAEYCYSYYESRQSNYGLYVYVYNPQGLAFDTNTDRNKISLGYGGKANYDKYSLTFLNYSTASGAEGLFYKFKVNFTKAQRVAILDGVNKAERVYELIGLELSVKNQVVDYKIAQKYKYSGYSKGYAPFEGAESTLNCTVDGVDKYLQLDVHSTYWRPSGTNGEAYSRDTLHSVYFSVPNYLIEEYGEMTAVHATWLNALTSPVFVTGNETVYNEVSKYLGQYVDGGNYYLLSDKNYNTELTYSLLACKLIESASWNHAAHGTSYVSYNANRRYTNSDLDIYTLAYCFLADKVNGERNADNYVLPAEMLIGDKEKDICGWFETYTEAHGGELVNNRFSKELFAEVADSFTNVTIRNDDTFTLTDEVISQSLWQKFVGGGYNVTGTNEYKVSAIKRVDKTDFKTTKTQTCDELYINESDYAEFKAFYDKVTKKDKPETVYLFRYYQSAYTHNEVATFTRGNDGALITGFDYDFVDTNAYFMQMWVQLDFDIIDVTFTKDNVDTVIPVVMSPVDLAADGDTTLFPTDDNNDWWKIVLAVLAVILLCILLAPILPYIIQFIVWLVLLPFKAIGALFKGIGKAANKRKRGK